MKIEINDNIFFEQTISVKNKIIDNTEVKYFYEIDREVIKLYYKMKNKNGFSFTDEEKNIFEKHILISLKQNIDFGDYDLVLYPETQNKCFKNIINSIELPSISLKKNTKQKVLEKLKEQKMMKTERIKLVENINQMDDIKIGLIAANQRKRIAEILFEISDDLKDKKIIFLDDSIFTGNTFKIINKIFKPKKSFVLFSNQ